jgi:hypothetical protein
MKEIQNATAAAHPREVSQAQAASEVDEIQDSHARAKARHSDCRKSRPNAAE